MRRVLVTALLGAVTAVVTGCGGGGFSLSAGDCLTVDREADPASGMGTVTKVHCDRLHDLEVFHVFDLTDLDVLRGSPQQGAQRLLAPIVAGCLEGPFERYVGIHPDASSYQLFPIPPSQDELLAGDRTVACTVYTPSGPTAGTARDARR